MPALFSSFTKSSKAEWVELIHKELKGAPADTLQKFNRVEEISLPAYFHPEDAGEPFADPGQAPFTRGTHPENNDWMIGSCFRIENEQTTNRQLLDTLMKGTTALVLHAANEQDIDFDLLLKDVGLEFIFTTFYPATEAQAIAFAGKAGRFPSAIVWQRTASWVKLASGTKNTGLKPFAVNGYAVQQTGATTWQELAIVLAEGHEYLVEQLELGLRIDEAAANIHFVLGIGNKYFYEIAKLRAFRTAWSRIVAAYNPVNPGSSAAFITAKTGFMHISLKDPYTNLLRQSTEAMSAVIGGVDQLVVQPYDWHAVKQNTDFTRRMAVNISLLLKEESYLGVVADPAGGSYAIDDLTRAIAERAWAGFKEIEHNGGLDTPAVAVKLSQEIKEKADQRLQLVRDKQQTLIGINAFPNPQAVDNTWQALPEGWNHLPVLIIEHHLHEA